MCLDAAGWTAVFTGLLVLVTWLLWTNAQAQLAEQHRTTVLLRKPFIVIGNPLLGPSKPDFSDWTIFFTVTNGGETAAWEVKIYVDVFIDNVLVEPRTKRKLGHLASGEGYGMLIDLTQHREATEDERLPLYFIATFVYNDIEKKDNEYSYRADHDYDRNTWRLQPGASVIN